MPQAVPIIIAAVGTAAGAAAAGATLSTIVALTALSVGLGLVSQALAPKPKNSSFSSEAFERTQQIRQAAPPRRVVYGEVKVSGPLAYAENSTDKKYLHLGLMLATHEVEKIGTIYLNDDPIFTSDIDGSGNVISGKFSGKVRIKKHLGADDQAADSDLIAEIPGFTTNDRGQGIAYVNVRYESDPDLFPSGIPNLAADVKGKKFYDPRTSTSYWNPNPSLAWRDLKTSMRYGMKLSSSKIDDSYVNSAANSCEEFVAVKSVAQQVNSVSSSEDVLQLEGDLVKFQTGDRIQVTTTGTLPTGISASTNYYVIVVRPRNASHIGCAIALASSYSNALSETKINITAAGSGVHTITKNAEPRYTCNGSFAVEGDPGPKLKEITGSMAGFACKPGAKWLVFAGVWRTPSISFDMDDLRDSSQPVELVTKYSKSERFNSVQGKYVSPQNYGVEDDYPLVSIPTYVEQDGGEEIIGNLDLPYTSRSQTCQRISRIELERNHREFNLSIKLNATGYLAMPGSIIQFTYPRFGFSSKTFEVVDWTRVVEEINGDPFIGVDLVVRESDSNIYNFDETTDEKFVNPALRSNLPSAFDISPPDNLTLSSGTDELFVSSDGTVVSRIKAEWTAPASAFVNNYVISFKKSTETIWTSLTLPRDATAHYIAPVEDGVAYDVKIRAINRFNKSSDDAESLGHIVIGKTEPPPEPDSFTVTRLADGTRRFAFSQTAMPADVRVGGGFVIRYYLGTTSDWSAMTPLHSGVIAASPFESNELAAGTYTFACKTVDSSGNESENAKFIALILGNPRLRNALYQQLEHPDWPGTKTDCYVDSDGTLRSTSSGDWTDLPSTWSGLADEWDSLVAQNSPIVYETEVIDLGIDTSFTPLVTVEGNGTQTIEIKTGSTADGNVTGSYGAISGQAIGKRYVQFKIEMSDATAPSISSMIIILDGEVNIENYEDVDTSSETASWFESIAAGHFRIGSKEGAIQAITKAQISAIQNVGAGWTWELINKNSTVNSLPAAEFKVYNSSGTLANAIVDVEIKGPA